MKSFQNVKESNQFNFVLMDPSRYESCNNDEMMGFKCGVAPLKGGPIEQVANSYQNIESSMKTYRPGRPAACDWKSAKRNAEHKRSRSI